MNARLLASAALAAALLVPASAFAHFILQSPNSWLVENKLGDPQKKGPCGGTTAQPGTPTNAINQAMGGDMITIKVQETIYHPGHYRVALAIKDRAELPADPEIMTRDGPRGMISVSAKIVEHPTAPIIQDGLFVHTTAPKPGETFETKVKLPNVNCDHCTLQVVEFMAEHGYNNDGGFTYHHCADYNITANPKLPIDKAWPYQGKK